MAHPRPADVYELLDSEDDDEDLQRAIRLSLESVAQRQPPPPSQSSSSSRRPKLSKRKVQHIDLTASDDEKAAPPKMCKLTSLPAVKPAGLAAYDRKQMEMERLQRQRRAGSAAGGTSATGQSPTSASSVSLPYTEAVPPSGFYGRANGEGHMNGDFASKFRAIRTEKPKSGAPARFCSGLAENKNSVLKYPLGLVKKTATEGFPKTSDDVTIEEVLQRDTLTTTVLSAFAWDDEWIMSKLPLHKKDLDLLLVMQGKNVEQREMREQVYGDLPKISLCFPSMDGQINCMHSKLMLLFHKEGKNEWLRVVVPTANLTEYDWGGLGGIMENMVFMIDLPLLPDAQQVQTPFLDELLYFCGAQGMPDRIISKITQYNFAETKTLAFVHTIGGSHGGNAWKRTGYCGLGTAIKRLGLFSRKGLRIDYVTSSVGAANEQFLSAMYRSAMGDNGARELERRLTKKPPSKRQRNARSSESDSELDDSERLEWEHIRERFAIYFPSKDTVIHSRGGKNAGGTICFQPQWWFRADFPKTMVKDTKSIRAGLLMHSKILFARPSVQLQTEAGSIDAWAYVGSANLSESAWGKLVKGPKLNCKNWECGVVIPVRAKDAGHTLSGEAPARAYPVGMSAFEGTIPVPMQVPAESLIDKEPWFFMKEIDIP